MDKHIEINGKLYTEQEVSEAVVAAKDAFYSIREAISEAIEILSKALGTIIHDIPINEKKMDFICDWQTPKIIPMTDQVLDRRPMITNTRNSI